MAGKKGRSGPPGNLHNARSVLPVLRRLTSGKPLPPELVRIGTLVESQAVGLEGDKGGRDSMTAGEQAMLDIWRTARTATLLILAEMIERGAIVQMESGWDLAPGAQRLARFLAEERQALLALGLNRRAKEVDLAVYLADKARDGEADNERDGA